MRLRGELTGSRGTCSATALPGRFAPALRIPERIGSPASRDLDHGSSAWARVYTRLRRSHGLSEIDGSGSPRFADRTARGWRAGSLPSSVGSPGREVPGAPQRLAGLGPPRDHGAPEP